MIPDPDKVLIEPTTAPNGDGVYDAESCWYENEAAYWATHLGACGCGDPLGYLDYIREGLQHLADRQHRFKNETYTWEWDKAWKDVHFGNDNAEQFFWYWADSLGLIEHGGSVFGAWLTERGARLVVILSKLNLTEDEP